MQYVNLNTLKIETTTPDDKIMVNVAIVPYNDTETISSQWLNTRAAVKKAFDPIDRPTRPHKFEFEVATEDELSLEAFESAVKLILTAAFEELVGRLGLGRPREYRLDVPENLKTVNCNMTLLKRAINYKTTVDKFQIEIYSGDLRYVLVGGFDE